MTTRLEPTPTSRRLLPGKLHAIFLLSGIAGLGYQLAFVRMFAAGLGHEMPSVLAVVGAFFGGLAFGAWTLDGPVSRSPRPGHWYMGLELTIGLWGLACAWLIGGANDLALRLMGVTPAPWWQWVVSLGVPMAVLLPATMAMGATLPAMERFAAPLASGGRCVGGLYAANTAGAVVGTLLGAFVLVPVMGYRTSVIVLAGVNLLCALLIVPMLRPVEAAESDAAVNAVSNAPLRLRRRIFMILFVTGLLGLGYEIVGLRVISQVIENTVYSYAAALAVFLAGTVAGAAVFQRAGGNVEFEKLLGYLLCGLATACMLGGVGLAYSREIYHACRHSLGDSTWAVMLSEMAVASLVFLIPTLLMGATFSHLTQAVKRTGGGVGMAVAINTAGGSLAPLLVGVVMMPTVGTKWTMASVALGYLALIIHHGKVARWALVMPLVVLLLLPDNLRLVRTFEGQHLHSYREGVMASVAVIENDKGHRQLRVNNRYQMGGTSPASRRMELRQGHIPLLLHPAPLRALFLGLGTGITAMAAADHPGLEADAVELLPEVVALLPAFIVDGRSLRDAPRVRVVTADARRFVRVTRAGYDVIVADLFHPARDGGGTLYTREHFEAVRERLNDGGLFCQWLPMYQLDDDMLRVIIHTFGLVFPDARAVMHDINLNYPAVALIGPKERWPNYAGGWLASRVVDDALRRRLDGLGLQRDEDLFGLLITDSVGLAKYAGAGPINTDNRPIVVYRAPRFAASRGQTSYGRLSAMLEEVVPEPAAWGIDDPVVQSRLTSWIDARDRAIARAIQQSSNRQSMNSR